MRATGQAPVILFTKWILLEGTREETIVLSLNITFQHSFMLIARMYDENAEEMLKTFRPKINKETKDWRRSRYKELHAL
jgi:hypothetical protein